MLLLGSFGDGREYVSFIIERGTWRFACVVMIDVVVELEILVIADVLLFVYLSFESTTTTTTPNPIANDPSITTTPHDDDDDDDDDDDAGHGCCFLAPSAMAVCTYL